MGKRQQVLIVEDDAINRKTLAKILSQKYDVLEASDGVAGLEVIKKCDKELAAVILDLHMPVMDGFALLGEIAKLPYCENLLLIVATGENDPVIESRCLAAGAWDFVTKPYHP